MLNNKIWIFTIVFVSLFAGLHLYLYGLDVLIWCNASIGLSRVSLEHCIDSSLWYAHPGPVTGWASLGGESSTSPRLRHRIMSLNYVTYVIHFNLV